MPIWTLKTSMILITIVLFPFRSVLNPCYKNRILSNMYILIRVWIYKLTYKLQQSCIIKSQTISLSLYLDSIKVISWFSNDTISSHSQDKKTFNLGSPLRQKCVLFIIHSFPLNIGYFLWIFSYTNFERHQSSCINY